MNQLRAVSVDQADAPTPATVEQFIPAQPLERRRLQAYLAQMLGDILSIFVGFGTSGYLYLDGFGIDQAAILAQLVLPVFLTIALYNGAYSLSTLRSARTGALRALGALGISAAVVVFITFYTKSSAEFSRVLFTGGVMLSGLILVWTRAQMRAFVRWRCGERLINELLIDDGGPAVELPGAIRLDAKAMKLIPALDNPAQLNRIGAVLNAIDRVVVSCPPARRTAWATILKGANIEGEVIDPNVAALGAHGARVVDGHGLLRVSVGPLGLRARAAKRLFDLLLAGGGLLLLSPLLLLVAIAILLEDGSPVLFVQRRVGRGNRFFDMLKFRSMRAELSDGHGQLSTSRNDQRVTHVGRLIRRTSIDELPQLFNVLKGEMAIVGPRPHALGSHAGEKLFWEVDDRYWERHALKPGLTGLAQVRGQRGATEREEDLAQRLESDLEYLDGWSLWRDLRIVASTVMVIVHQRAF